MNRPRYVRLELVPTDRTDLLCIACGNFTIGRGHFAVSNHADPVVGVHKGCVSALHVKRTGNTSRSVPGPSAQAHQPEREDGA